MNESGGMALFDSLLGFAPRQVAVVKAEISAVSPAVSGAITRIIGENVFEIADEGQVQGRRSPFAGWTWHEFSATEKERAKKGYMMPDITWVAMHFDADAEYAFELAGDAVSSLNVMGELYDSSKGRHETLARAILGNIYPKTTQDYHATFSDEEKRFFAAAMNEIAGAYNFLRWAGCSPTGIRDVAADNPQLRFMYINALRCEWEATSF